MAEHYKKERILFVDHVKSALFDEPSPYKSTIIREFLLFIEGYYYPSAMAGSWYVSRDKCLAMNKTKRLRQLTVEAWFSFCEIKFEVSRALILKWSKGFLSKEEIDLLTEAAVAKVKEAEPQLPF